jgi:hypothetical protein
LTASVQWFGFSWDYSTDTTGAEVLFVFSGDARRRLCREGVQQRSMIGTLREKRDAAGTFVLRRAVMGQVRLKFISATVNDTDATMCAMGRWQVPGRTFVIARLLPSCGQCGRGLIATDGLEAPVTSGGRGSGSSGVAFGHRAP